MTNPETEEPTTDADYTLVNVRDDIAALKDEMKDGLSTLRCYAVVVTGIVSIIMCHIIFSLS